MERTEAADDRLLTDAGSIELLAPEALVGCAGGGLDGSMR